MDELVVNNLFNGVYNNRRVLVTGHTGFKGSWLVMWLEKMGAIVCGYSLEANTDPAHYNLLKLDMRSEIADIRNVERLNKVIEDFKPEIVFHLAAQPLVRLSYKEPVSTYSTNVMGTLYLLEACRNTDSIRAIVVVTSDKCYENKEWVWGYRENDPMGGYDPYSSSKGCTELVVASYRDSYFNIADYTEKHSILLATARAGNVIGGGDWADDRLIPDVIRSVANKEQVRIRNPKATRPWQHVLEPLSGYLLLGCRLFEGEKKMAGPWNFGPEATGTLNVGEVLVELKKNWNKIDFVADKGEHPHEAGLLKLDCSKANQILNWREVWDIRQTIEQTVNWYKLFYESNLVISEDQLKLYIEQAYYKSIEWTIHS